MTLYIPGLQRCSFAVLVFQDPGFCPWNQFFQAVHGLVDHPGGQRLVRGHLDTLEQVRQGLLQSQQVHHAHNAAAARQQAQSNFRQAQLYAAVIPGHTVVTAQADFKATAEGGTINCRHYRYR